MGFRTKLANMPRNDELTMLANAAAAAAAAAAAKVKRKKPAKGMALIDRSVDSLGGPPVRQPVITWTPGKKLTKAEYEMLLERPVWKDFGNKPIIAKRAVTCDGRVVVERADGAFSVNSHMRYTRLRKARHDRYLSDRWMGALLAFKLYTEGEIEAILAYRDERKRTRDREEELVELGRLATKHNFRLPRRLQMKPEPVRD